ncbi:MAG: aminodeoxychorismate/anthranilate synthase component II, partial [Actinomycetospora chiangmaiensis]|nr:aminodeoxychorismate/anthranilate synthase component II [Actinomycetospora chiangmaiensis]
MILVLDNYDSFVFNVVRYFEELGEAVRVVRN